MMCHGDLSIIEEDSGNTERDRYQVKFKVGDLATLPTVVKRSGAATYLYRPTGFAKNNIEGNCPSEKEN